MQRITSQGKSGFGRAEESFTPPAVQTPGSQATGVASAMESVPSCATSCMFSAISADGCQISDFKCHCSSGEKIRPQLNPCITKACSPSDEDSKMKSPLQVEDILGKSKIENVCQEVFAYSDDNSSAIDSTPTPSVTAELPKLPTVTETAISGLITVVPIEGGNTTALIGNATAITADATKPVATSNSSAKTTKLTASKTTPVPTAASTSTSKALGAAVTGQAYVAHGVVAAVGGLLLIL
ncbi:hypothetical protein FGG08_000055 [Glutinoglossum americanum]|uniref:CFEM domain-containing protein n=1 Tax=Glutinoglossum americanum TaxID=1670608 RepID=A0A9P8I9Z5_9PEZI|nr:hypothetical protein FGG08_000055 [Glutinoglossum americanum]